MSKRTPPNLRMIALKNLKLSEINSRQIVDPAEVEAMAESIAVAGLLQNLIGYETPDGVEIIGGGKRLRALQLLAAEGWTRYVDMTVIDPVPVNVTDDITRAIAWSGTENTARSPLHPADEITAYAAMRSKGVPPHMIANSFAVTVAHVNRRLKLADLPEQVIANLRAGKITLDQAQIFTLAPTPKDAIEVLGALLNNRLPDWQLRSAFTKGQIEGDDRRVLFVGLDALHAAGAEIHQDLFQEKSYVADVGLLDRMTAEKGAALAESLRADGGWAWADFMVQRDYSAPYITLIRQPVDLPEADVERYDELSELANGDVLDAAGLAELQALETRMDGDFTDDDRATGGVLVWLKHDGTAVSLPCRRMDDAKTTQDQNDDGSVTATALPPKAPPQNILDDLRKIKLLALQTALLEQPSLCLDLLAFQLTQPQSHWHKPLAITTSAPPIQPEKPEGTTISPRLAEVATDHSAEATYARFYTFRKDHPRLERLELLGIAIARLINDAKGDLPEMLAHILQVDVRSVWTPTAAGYFKRLGSAALDAIYMDLTPADKADHTAFARMKNAEKAKHLDALFSDLSVREAMGLSRDENARIDSWLPPELQFPAIQATGDEQADESEAA